MDEFKYPPLMGVSTASDLFERSLVLMMRLGRVEQAADRHPPPAAAVVA
jgi:hypothetical protein